jgi:hypothetical protein
MVRSVLQAMKENYEAIVRNDSQFTTAYDMWCALRFWKFGSAESGVPKLSEVPIFDSTDFRKEISMLLPTGENQVQLQEQLQNLKITEQ